jgi:prevent-host-death family protein
MAAKRKRSPAKRVKTGYVRRNEEGRFSEVVDVGKSLGRTRPGDAESVNRAEFMRDRDQYPQEVGIAELKAHLSEKLARVRNGEQITVLDRATPVARIVPFRGDRNGITIRPPKHGAARPSQFRSSPTVARAFEGFDPVASLLEDRGGR